MPAQLHNHIEPISPEWGRQLQMLRDDPHVEEFEQRLNATQIRTNMWLGAAHGDARFTYQDIVEFSQTREKSPQEAGKIFMRFYRGLQQLDIEPPPYDYEYSRDHWKFPLNLLTAVISQLPENHYDAYDELLREYYSRRMGSLLVKQSTSE